MGEEHRVKTGDYSLVIMAREPAWSRMMSFLFHTCTSKIKNINILDFHIVDHDLRHLNYSEGKNLKGHFLFNKWSENRLKGGKYILLEKGWLKIIHDYSFLSWNPGIYSCYKQSFLLWLLFYCCKSPGGWLLNTRFVDHYTNPGLEHQCDD